MKDGQEGVVYMPAIYPWTAKDMPNPLRLGRGTEWQEDAGLVRGLGMREFLVGEEAKTLAEARRAHLRLNRMGGTGAWSRASQARRLGAGAAPIRGHDVQPRPRAHPHAPPRRAPSDRGPASIREREARPRPDHHRRRRASAWREGKPAGWPAPAV
jgi:hypothetical protein